MHDNFGDGLYIRAADGSAVNYNNFNNNSGTYELQNGGSGSVNAGYNYWGAPVTADMANGANPKDITRIYDIYDDPGKGAAYGAAAGLIRGRRRGRSEQQQAQQAAESQGQQAQANIDKQMGNFKKAFSVCLESKDYMVKY